MPKTDKSEEAPSAELVQIQELYEMMVTEGLDVLELKDADQRIRLSRALPMHIGPMHHARPHAAVATVTGNGPAPVALDSRESIKAPLAGVFYRASSPTGAAFAKEGDVVQAGQTLCIVEAMKVMNEIKAEKACRIAKIAAENARPVTVGQPLFWIEPA
jgi:acetyl-CoA carboxylase biotin carboxyl carrier protein